MASEKMTICLEEFIIFCLKKWKMIVAVVWGFAILFAGMTKIVGEEISVPHSEEYLYYEQESQWLEKYLDESVLMKLNPTCIPEKTLFLEDISDKEKLKDYVSSKRIWDEFETEQSKSFFYELVTWNSDESNQSAQLTIRYITEEECSLLADYLKTNIEKYDKNIIVTLGENRIVQDEELQDEQLRWYDRIEYSKSLLLEAQAGYTLRINLAAAVITGVLCGGVISVAVVFVMFLRENSKKKSNL